MLNILWVGLTAGLLFGVMDGLINANPLARRLNEVYAPVAKARINVPAGVAIDLGYGLIMAVLFWLLHPALPGETALIKGLSYGGIIWFFRVVMAAATTWMTHRATPGLLAYNLAAGLVEMLVLGAYYGALVDL